MHVEFLPSVEVALGKLQRLCNNEAKCIKISRKVEEKVKRGKNRVLRASF